MQSCKNRTHNPADTERRSVQSPIILLCFEPPPNVDFAHEQGFFALLFPRKNSRLQFLSLNQMVLSRPTSSSRIWMYLWLLCPCKAMIWVLSSITDRSGSEVPWCSR